MVNESTDVSTTTILILFAKFHTCNDTNYKTVFAGTLQLTACDSAVITATVKDFYTLNHIDKEKMVMST